MLQGWKMGAWSRVDCSATFELRPLQSEGYKAPGPGNVRARREWVSAIITVQESALINGVMCECKTSIIAEHGSAKCRWAVDAGTELKCTMQCACIVRSNVCILGCSAVGIVGFALFRLWFAVCDVQLQCPVQGLQCRVCSVGQGSAGHKVPLCGMKPSDPCLALFPTLIHNSLNDRTASLCTELHCAQYFIALLRLH